jgi:BirA family biotin operon repressor/biotin-[acetyl-CoA-carboxylase] ligase
MQIIHLETVDSTHSYLKEYLKHNAYTHPVCIVCDEQTHGIGSRGNHWSGVKGNLFFSFVVSKKELPEDLPLQSASIYFSFILKKILNKQGSKVWLKWPNDFYVKDLKVGGAITTMNKELVLCGIGLNLVEVSHDFGILDIKTDVNILLNEYFANVEKKIFWQEIFSEYVIEFQNSKKFQATINGQKVSLEGAILNNDGSIQINNEKVFSLR